MRWSKLVLPLLLMLSAPGSPCARAAGSETAAQQLYDAAVMSRENGDFQKARAAYLEILTSYPQYEFIDAVHKELSDVLMKQIQNPVAAPEAVEYQVEPEDTLAKIAKKFSTTIELIRKRNHLTGDIIRPGQKLSIWKATFHIAIDKAKNTLQLSIAGPGPDVAAAQGAGESGPVAPLPVKTYPVSTGKSQTQTPVGEFTIVYRYPNPTWFHKGEIVPPGEENFLGTRWLGLDKPQFGIHGTIFPELIGQSVSGGCVRMKNEDVEELYDIVPKGTKVVIVEQ